MDIVLIIILIWAAASGIAFWLLIENMGAFRRKVLREKCVTNGDVTLCVLISILPVGLFVALAVTAIDGFGDKGREWSDRRSSLFDRTGK